MNQEIRRNSGSEVCQASGPALGYHRRYVRLLRCLRFKEKGLGFRTDLWAVIIVISMVLSPWIEGLGVRGVPSVLLSTSRASRVPG